jgi:hypothetical protein
MSTHPEHDKLEAVREKSQTIGEFMEWLQTTKGAVLRRWVECTENAGGFPFDEPRAALAAFRGSITDLLAEFFGIDQQRLEAEKRDMLAAAREEH